MCRTASFLAVSTLVAACSGSSVTTTPMTTTSRPPGVPSAELLPEAGDSMMGRVTRVLDGDSLVVEVAGDEVEVRLLGINAPEEEECFGDVAGQALVASTLGAEVSISGEELDQFGRLLAYVDRGNLPLGVSQLAAGNALALSIDHPRNSLYFSAERSAVAGSVGLWAESACGGEPGDDVFITLVQWDAPGVDGENLNGEAVVIANEGDVVDISGWMLRDESTRWRFRFPDGRSLQPGERVTVRTGCQSEELVGLFWCADDPIWNNDGDTALLLDGSGNVVDRFVYGPKS